MALRVAARSVLMALGKPWMRIGFEVAGLVILVIAATTLTARLGTIGLPLALVCSEWGVTVLGWVLIRMPVGSKASIAP
jgi:O-antigen/teichoic acid export membrane protein